MASVHGMSSEGLKSELDLFSVPLTQKSIESAGYVHYKPLSSLGDGSVIDFVVEGRGDSYIDLGDTILAVTAKVVKNDNTPLDANDEVAPVNYFLHSLFSQVDIYLNQRLITPSSNTYPYRAYIETCLGYDKSSKDTHLQMGLYHKDTAGEFNTLGVDNTGYTARKALVAESSEVVMMGRIHSELFKQDRYLLNGVEMCVKLIRSKDAFCLMAAGDAATSKVVITDATLMVRKARISPSIMIAHANTLKKATAKYPLTRVDVKTVTIPAQLQAKTVDNLVLGVLPKRVILGFVLNSAYNGAVGHNPFNFEHFQLNHLVMYVDGVQIPSKPLTPSFAAHSSGCVSMYHTLLQGCGINSGDHGNDISLADYANGGYVLVAFDLTADNSASTGIWSVQRHGSLRLEVRFGAPLAAPITCICYCEYDSLLEIDFDRNVTTDYGV